MEAVGVYYQTGVLAF